MEDNIEHFIQPEFEQRARKFILEAKQSAENPRIDNHRITLRIYDFYSDILDGLDQLEEIFGESQPVRPRDIADEIDKETADSFVVGFEARFDSRKALKEYLDMVTEIAKEKGGYFDESVLPEESTIESDGFIRKESSEVYPISYYTQLYFRFESLSEV